MRILEHGTPCGRGPSADALLLACQINRISRPVNASGRPPIRTEVQPLHANRCRGATQCRFRIAGVFHACNLAWLAKEPLQLDLRPGDDLRDVWHSLGGRAERPGQGPVHVAAVSVWCCRPCQARWWPADRWHEEARGAGHPCYRTNALCVTARSLPIRPVPNPAPA
jgi:hypothetical protein